MIENSQRCLLWGLLSLFPVVGMAFAVHALFLYRRACRAAPDEWNPARRHLLLGLTAALVGLVLSLGSIALVCWAFSSREFIFFVE